MQSRQFGLGSVLFLYTYDSASGEALHRFGGATELVALFHAEGGMTPLMRRVHGLETESSWRCYVQHKEGSLVSTDIVVSADNEAQALTGYYEACLHQILNQRILSPGGKSFFLCEGERGLLWLLDQGSLSELFRQHHPLLPDSFFTDEALSDWMAYGSLSRPEYMDLLAKLADAYPKLISPAQRIQLGLQIVQRERETPGLESKLF